VNTTKASIKSGERDFQIKKIASILCPFLLGVDSSVSEKVTDDSETANSAYSSLMVKPLLGGLSNELFVVESAYNRTSALVRIHPTVSSNSPSSSFSIVDREVENRLSAWLSREEIKQNKKNGKKCGAPIFYGRFENGRIEEYFLEVEPLSYSQMGEYGPKIANILAALHDKQVPESVMPSTREIHPFGDIWSRVDEWLHTAQKTETEQVIDELLDELEKEWTWLKTVLMVDLNQTRNDPTTTGAVTVAVTEFCQELVLTHMDAQSLNLLKTKDNDLRLIDYEYAGFNPRALDIANTFCEHCDMNNIKADYRKEYPTTDVQNAFLVAYLQSVDLSSSMKSILLINDARDEVLRTMRDIVGRYTLVSHLGWAIWSVVQNQLPSDANIDFDYVAYARHRIVGYRIFQQKYY